MTSLNFGRRGLIVPVPATPAASGWHPLWDASTLEGSERVADNSDRGTRAQSTRYPFRYLRYWFVRHMLERRSLELGRPLRVLEVGVHRGQMMTFATPQGASARPGWIGSWDALDCAIDAPRLRALGYDRLISADLDDPREPEGLRAGGYDAVIALHLLEHLQSPDSAVRRFVSWLAPEGEVMGGSPTMPGWLAGLREWRLRRTKRPRQHQRVITPGRVKGWARELNLRPTLLTGAFLTRNSGRAIENSRAWLRLNLAWGALAPALGSEIYFALRARAR